MTVAKGSRRRLSRATAVGVPAACLSLVIAVFAIHEGREAWEGELVEDDDDDDDD